MARYDHVTKIHQSLTADHASLVPRDIRARKARVHTRHTRFLQTKTLLFFLITTHIKADKAGDAVFEF